MAKTYNFGDAVLIQKFANAYEIKDVIYFKYPVQDTALTNTFFMQRLFGLPGDSVNLSEKLVYCNGFLIKDTSTIKHNYFIQTKNHKPQTLFKFFYGLTEGGQVSDEFDYCYSLTHEESELLAKDSAIKSVTMKMEKKNNFDETCFPANINFKWNMDHFGKLYIPKINDTLQLDSLSMKLYSDLISNHEKNQLEIRQDSIIINGQYSTYYVVKKNYYFVLGDNRDNSNDSRVWGLLPENCILGKVTAVVRRK